MKVPPEWRQTPPEASGKGRRRVPEAGGARWALKENPERSRLSGSLRRRHRSRLRQVSAPDVGQVDLTSRMQQRQVSNQAF